MLAFFAFLINPFTCYGSVIFPIRIAFNLIFPIFPYYFIFLELLVTLSHFFLFCFPIASFCLALLIIIASFYSMKIARHFSSLHYPGCHCGGVCFFCSIEIRLEL